jgi:repressor LexA
MPPLTGRQTEVYDFIRAHVGRHHRAPTLREIGSAVGLKSTNAVSKVLKALEAKGYIAREEGRARAIILLEDEPLAAAEDEVPLLPIASPSARPDRLRRRPEGYLALDADLLPPGLEDPERTCILLRAGDDGMAASATGILRGDLVVVRECEPDEVEDGTLVAAFVGRTLQVRRCSIEGGRVFLRASNKQFSNAAFDPDDARLTFVGEVVALVRSYRGAVG